MITQQEFETLLADTTKRIEGALSWREDEDHSPSQEFRAEVTSDSDYSLFVVGRINPWAGTLSYTLIHRKVGRIYALDLGADHHNPTCERVGEKHKHLWCEEFRDKAAYALEYISAPWNCPVEVWQQFCTETNIEHQDGLADPPAKQEEMFP